MYKLSSSKDMTQFNITGYAAEPEIYEIEEI